MPNIPLQNFRAVEPANFGFAAGATLASQPFVLYHEQSTAVVGAGTPGTNVAATFLSTFAANRFQPWLWRNNDACYPVDVPNAYDRIHVWPLYIVSSSNSANAPSTLTFGNLTSYAAPFIVPFGLAPQTRGFTTANRLNPLAHRLPDDILAAAGLVSSFDTRANGLWNVLPPYASNFSTSNGLMAVGSATNPTSFGRATTGTGLGYALPDDFSISNAGTGALSESAAQYATGGQVLIGMGHDFQTMGCEEIVISPGASPTGISFNHPGTNGASYRVNYFLMGALLG